MQSEDRPLGGSKKFNFEEFPSESPQPLSRNERPLGGKGNYGIPPEATPNYEPGNSEDTPEEAGEEESGTIEKRLESKMWKTRDKAVDELFGLIQVDSSVLRTYSSFVLKIVGDPHPAVQEKGFELFKAYFSQWPEFILSETENFTKGLIEKGITSAKPTIRQASTDILLDLFENQPINTQPYIQGVISTLDNKLPKIQTAGVSYSISLLNTFGARVVPFNTFLPYIEKFAAGSNAGLRTEALNYFKELYKWVREIVLPSLQGLKKPQQVELQKAFDEIKEVPVPIRYLKCRGPEKKEKQGKPLDVYEMAEARDIFSKFNQEWVEKVLGMEKWADKKAALEQVNLEANYPKLADKNPGALVDLAKKLVNDNNVNVMVQAVKLVGLLSKGLRKSFEIHSRQFFSIFLSKLKEKKTLVIQEVYLGLDNLLFSLPFESVLIELEEALDDKANALKMNLLIWLQKSAEGLPNEQILKAVKEITGMVKKLTDDNTASIRNESFKVIFLLLKRFPDQVNPALKDFPPAKMKKVQEMGGEDVEEKKVEEKKVEEKKIVEKSVPEPAKLEKPIKKPIEKPGKKVKNSNQDEDFTNLITPEDAEQVLSELIPSSIIPKLKETSWKDKLAGLQDLYDWTKKQKDSVQDCYESIFRLVKTCLKDWKENNMAVNKLAFDLLNLISETTDINRKSAYIILTPAALERLSEGKISESYTVCILTICEAVGPKFVVTHIVKSTSDCTKPKLFAECCTVISRILADFGIHRVVLKDIVDCCKLGLSQSNPIMKKASTSLLSTIFSFIGEALLPFLKDIKEATLKSVNEELSKVEKSQNTSFRKVRNEEEEVKYDPKKVLDNALPRANIGNLISEKILKKLTDGNWKVRKEGLDDIEGILEANGKRVLVVGLEEMFKLLKSKLEDANKSIVRSTLTLVAKLIESIGSEIMIYSKYIVPSLLGNLADKQSLLRQDALATIDKWSAETGPESIVNYSGGPLMQDNPELRTELLNWLLAHKEIFPKCDLKQLASGILGCLQDRTANIRNAAENLFSEVVNLIGFESFSSLLTDIKPAVLNTLKPIFEKYRTEEVQVEKTEKKVEGSNKSKPVKRSMTNKVVADHEVKTSTRNKKDALDIRISTVGEKEKRLDFDSRYKWSVEEIRPDYFDKLKEQIKQAFSPDLFNLMFHEDFKKQAEAAGHLQSIIESSEFNLLDYFDLVFKWSWIELIISSNTQIYKAVLELDLNIVGKLESLNYTVSDTEANLILPVLCDKSGQNNVVFRVLIRNIIHSFCKIYAPDKVFIIVLAGVNSKNARSKVECIEEIGSLIKDFGETVLQAKDVKVLSKQVNSADNNVRAAAVNTIGEIFKIWGDKTWGLIGELPEKAKGILEQRFKVKGQEKVEEVKKPQNNHKKSIDRKPEIKKPETPGNKPKIMQSPKFTEDKVSLSSTLKMGELRKNHEKNQFSDPKKDSSKVDMNKVAEKIFNLEKDLGKIGAKETLKTSPREFLRVDSGDKIRSPREHSTDRPPRSARIPSPKLSSDTEGSKKAKHLFIEEIEIAEQEKPKKNFEILSSLAGVYNLNIDEQILALENFSEQIENKVFRKRELKSCSSQICFVFVSNCCRILNTNYYNGSFCIRFFKVTLVVCSCENVVKYWKDNEIFFLCEELLRVLLSDLGFIEDGNEVEQVSRLANSCLIRILDIVKTGKMMCIVIRLLSGYKSLNVPKANSILFKCLLKVAKGISLNKSQLDLDKVLESIYSYLGTNEETDEVGQKTMKTIINELVKTVGEEIIPVYQSFNEQHPEDPYLGDWIEICLRANSSIPSSSAIPQSPSSISTESYKELLDLLASSETYTIGVQALSNFLDSHPDIDPFEVLGAYPNAFKEKILADVREYRSKKTQPAGFNSSEMQNRIAVMKQRLGLGAGSTPTDLNAKVEDLTESLDSNKLALLKSKIQNFSKN